jgi:multiple antibiotic resistance protein
MFSLFEPFILAFIPVFVAVDSLGNVPVFLSLIDGMNRAQRQRTIAVSVTTATVMALLFMLVGKVVFNLIGISVPDFQIAGGVLLFVIATRLLLPGNSSKAPLSDGNKEIAVFPLGTPLITGPAVLTTTIMMLDTYGLFPTFVSLTLNMGIVWVVFANSGLIVRIMGINGTKAFAKVIYILLAAIGVMMIRKGITAVIAP